MTFLLTKAILRRSSHLDSIHQGDTKAGFFLTKAAFFLIKIIYTKVASFSSH